VKLKVIGWVLIVIGFIDFGLSWVGVDLTGWIVGSTLSEYTVLFFGGLGGLLLTIVAIKKQKSETLADLNENEVLLKKGSVVMKQSTLKQENGVLILTNQRLIYKGTEDIEIPVQNISSAKGSVGTMSITQKDGTEIKYVPGMITLKTWIELVSETINSSVKN
tara:strand:- start:359 stop:847 length:489 start_codon:yes stop_codon:yes gene_type:complete